MIVDGTEVHRSNFFYGSDLNYKYKNDGKKVKRRKLDLKNKKSQEEKHAVAFVSLHTIE